MGERIPEEIIAQVRERVNIVDLVRGHVELKRSGANYVGLCPFHHEKTPSFSVNEAKQFFHCFGCGVGGNVFSFVMQMEGLSFPQAVKQLAQRCGVEIPEREASAEQLRRQREREQLRAIYTLAAQFYHNLLLGDECAGVARSYLRRRGFSGDMARRFRLGFAPDSWDALCNRLRAADIELEQARKLGLVCLARDERRYYDMFRQRLLFPIEDDGGNVVAFGGRVLDDSLPKYINSPESPLYQKSRVLYGLHQAKTAMRQRRSVVVVEGYFDHLALVQAGVENVVATCGTALTGEHARILTRYVETVVLLFDQDNAGQKACFRAMPALLAAGLQVNTLALPPGDDPDSCVQREGAQAFSARLDNAVAAVDYHMQTVLAAAGENVAARARAIEAVLEMIRAVKNEIERDLYLDNLAQASGLTREALQRQLKREPTTAPPLQRRPQAPAAVAAASRAEIMLLGLMFASATACEQAAEDGWESFFVVDDCRFIAGLIAAAWQRQQQPGHWLLDQCDTAERQSLLTKVMLAGSQLDSENMEQIFADCRLAVERGRLKQRLAQLHTQMREAEQQGDSDRYTVCLQEITTLNRQLKSRK